ncbi:MAG: ATP-binding protein [Thermonemataceae bacterium]
MIVFVASISFWFNLQRDRLANTSENMENALVSILRLIKVEQDFFVHEIRQPLFYQHGRSIYIDRHKERYDSILTNFKALKANSQLYSLDVRRDFEKIIKSLEDYDYSFKQVVILTRLRGFKDYGIEGYMREVAHEMEKQALIDKVSILQLRRLEKDYIVRKDIKYVVALEKQVEGLQQRVREDNRFSPAQKDTLYKQLSTYKKAFKKLVAYERTIGYEGTRQGFKYQMRYHANNAIKLIESVTNKLHAKSDEIAGDFQNIFIITMLIVVVLSLTFSYFLSFFITIPIVKLSQAMQDAVDHKLEGDIKPMKKYAEDEVGELTDDFNYMVKEIKHHVKRIKASNAIITERNEELEAINQQLIQSEKRLEGLLSLKDKFFSIISHDLRGPLNTLKGFLNILHNYTASFSTQELKALSGDMNVSLERMMIMLEDLLKWSRSQTGDLEYHPDNLNLSKIVEENITLLQQTARAKIIQIESKITPQLWVRADKNMLDFILRNLLSNAVKFTEEKGKIMVEAHADEYFTYIQVKDTGVGMSKETLRKLFHPETHISTPGTRQEKGTGFGLLMCKDFVEKNEGEIRVESKLGEGTTIYFSLQTVRRLQEID